MSDHSPTLEQRIAAALMTADVTSTDLSQLIAETEVGIATADATAEQERERALDPVKSPDPKQARQAMEEAIFARDRLRTLLPRLQQQHKEVQEKEYVERWRKDFERVEAKRDALAASMQSFTLRWWSGSSIFSSVSRRAIARPRKSTVGHPLVLAPTCAKSS